MNNSEKINLINKALAIATCIIDCHLKISKVLTIPIFGPVIAHELLKKNEKDVLRLMATNKRDFK